MSLRKITDAERFKEKYIPYYQKMYRVAYRLLEDMEDAEDMVQEAYIKLWNKRNELEHVENLESYCIVILRNLCMDLLRNKSRFHTQSTDDINIPVEAKQEDKIQNAEEMEYIEKIISRLPEQQQVVFRMRHFEDYSNEEIEKVTGLSAVNTRVLLSRARKKVQEIYNTYHPYGK